MSGLNQKGPIGQGPMTGRKLGKCTNFGTGRIKTTENIEQEENEALTQGLGRGIGRGLGRGLGMGGRGLGLRNQNRFRNGR